MSLNRRDIKLLEKINNNIFPISSLAEKYSVSERNIRYSIDNINFYLRKMELPEIVIKKGNLEFSINDKELDSFIEALNMNIYVFSQEERKDYILINYLFRENVKISEMEENLKVSRTTIKKDLKDLEKYLAEFELSFYRDENGMYITGKEKKLRHLKLLKMLDYIEIKNKNIVYIKKKYFNKKEEQKIIAEYIKEYDIKKISDVIDEIEEELNAHFTGEFKNIMGIYLIATFERIKNGHIIIQKNNSDFLRKLEEYRKIKNILKKVIDENQEYEILHLTEYFLSGYYNDTFSENILMLERFISKILENMDIEMGTHLLKDRELVEKFMKYLLPAIYRIKNNFYLNKKLDFSEIDIELFNKVKEIIEKNSHYLKEPLRDEEIFYVSKYIEEYMEQKRNKKISLKPLLYGGTGINSEDEDMPEELPERFEAGSPNILGIIGLKISTDELLKIGIQNIKKRKQENIKALYDLLEEYSYDLKILSDKENNVGVVSIEANDYTPQELESIFNDEGIVTRRGLHCAPLAHKHMGTEKNGTLRLSVGYFNDEEDLDKLGEVLESIF